MLTRSDLISGLRELAEALERRAHEVELRIVGGAALSLAFFERDVTYDIDTVRPRVGSEAVVLEEVSTIARKRGWPQSWLNFEVNNVDALPTLGKDVEWIQLYSQGGVRIVVASAEAMLAMKLRANRPGRDTGDIRNLIGACGLTAFDEISSLYEHYYPGDALPDRAVAIVSQILEEESIEPPAPPRAPFV